MKFVRVAAIVAGVADLAFAALFVLKPGAFHAEMEPKIYAQWVGLALLASAVALFIVASDPKRYLPVLYVDIGVRALAALFTVIYITHFTLFIAMLPSHAGLVAILVVALVYDMKLAQTGLGGKPAAKPGVERPAGVKPAQRPPGKPAGKPAARGSPAAKDKSAGRGEAQDKGKEETTA